MLCAISGEPPREPVVSKTSGHLFERSLIEKHIATFGTCPITNAALQMEDLVPLKGKPHKEIKVTNELFIVSMLIYFL